MSPNLKQLDDNLSKEYSKKSYAVLSTPEKGSPLVDDQTVEAYSFDEITKQIYCISLCSADALLIKDNLYFIEFKNIRDTWAEEKEDKREAFKKGLHLKCIESLYTLHYQLIPKAEIKDFHEKKSFIFVIDANKNPVSAMANAMQDLAGKALTDKVETSLKKGLKKYSQAEKGNKANKLFYDEVLVWNSVNFSSNIKKVK